MTAKTAVRNGIARLLYGTRATSAWRRSRGCLSIATFHRVLPEAERKAYPYPGLVVTPQELDELLSYFTRNFDCGHLANQHRRYGAGGAPEQPLLAVTFDDGQYDNYHYARPVLNRHGVKASFFVPVVAVQRQELLWHDRLGFAILAILQQGHTGQETIDELLSQAGMPAIHRSRVLDGVVEEAKKLTLEGRQQFVDAVAHAAGPAGSPDFARLMKFDELAHLASEGHEIGSHSMTHCMMPECDDTALAYEIAESRRILQARLSQPVESFCYPNGDVDGRTAGAVARAGYRRAVTTAWGNNGRQADPFQLRRFDMVADHMRASSGRVLPALVALRMSGLYPRFQ